MSDIEARLRRFRRADTINRVSMALAFAVVLALSSGFGLFALEWESAQQAKLLSPPPNWDEAAYLAENPDVQTLIDKGRFESGWHHYLANGINEDRRPPGLL